MADPVNVKTFRTSPPPAKGDGSVDDGPAISAALDEAILRAAADGGCRVIVPAGTYMINGPIAKTLNSIKSISIVGDGADLTEFRFIGASDGFSFTANFGNNYLYDTARPGNGFFLEGFSVSTDRTGTGVGFAVNGGAVAGRSPRKTYFRDITFRGHSSDNHRWADMVRLTDCSDIWFDSCRWWIGPATGGSTGVNFIGTVDGEPASAYFLHCGAIGGEQFLKLGDHFEGVYLTNCSHLAGNKAVYWNCAAESGLHVIGGHFSNFQHNFHLNGLYDFEIIGALLYASSNHAPTFYNIYVETGGRFTISGNVFRDEKDATTEVGVYVSNSPPVNAFAHLGSFIGGNTFSNIATDGIFLGANTRKITVGDNAFGTIGSKNVNTGGGTENYVAQRNVGMSHVWVLTGGTVNQVNLPISPAADFKDKPTAVQVTGSFFPLVGFYDWSAPANSPTNAVIDIRDITGAALPVGPVRFSVIVYE